MTTRHVVSISHAFAGLLYGFMTQPNFIIHSFISGMVIAASWYFQISSTHWAIILLTIAIGFSLEYLNTSIETTVDLITTTHHPLAKIAKDTAAAAMLVYAVGAILIASIIFIPKIF